MANYQIKCEIVRILANTFQCSRVGQTFMLGSRTPDGMCARAYAAIYPVALAMRFSEEIAWERGLGYLEVTCPDNDVVYRLTRVSEG